MNIDQTEFPSEMSDIPGLDELRVLSARLQRLLEDPYPGLTIWRMFLHETLKALGEYQG